MPTYTQYRGGYNNSYSSASNSALNNKIPIFKDYVQFRSGDNQYVLIIGDTNDGHAFTDATVYSIDGSSGTQTLNVNEYDDVYANYDNNYYTYNSFNNDYYTVVQKHEALCNSLVGFSLTGGVAICVILVFLRRLFLRR